MEDSPWNCLPTEVLHHILCKTNRITDLYDMVSVRNTCSAFRVMSEGFVYSLKIESFYCFSGVYHIELPIFAVSVKRFINKIKRLILDLLRTTDLGQHRIPNILHKAKTVQNEIAEQMQLDKKKDNALLDWVFSETFNVVCDTALGLKCFKEQDEELNMALFIRKFSTKKCIVDRIGGKKMVIEKDLLYLVNWREGVTLPHFYYRERVYLNKYKIQAEIKNKITELVQDTEFYKNLPEKNSASSYCSMYNWVMMRNVDKNISNSRHLVEKTTRKLNWETYLQDMVLNRVPKLHSSDIILILFQYFGNTMAYDLSL